MPVKVAAVDAERIEERTHVARMGLHRVVGEIDGWLGLVRFAATAPFSDDHSQRLRK
jgi:hypothetical protein